MPSIAWNGRASKCRGARDRINAEAFIESRRSAELEPYPPPGCLPERDDNRIGLYCRHRRPDEEERLPDDAIDPYPDSARKDSPDAESAQ